MAATVTASQQFVDLRRWPHIVFASAELAWAAMRRSGVLGDGLSAPERAASPRWCAQQHGLLMHQVGTPSVLSTPGRN